MGQKEIMDVLEKGALTGRKYKYLELAEKTKISTGAVSRCIGSLRKWYKINTANVKNGHKHYYVAWIDKKDLKNIYKNPWDN